MSQQLNTATPPTYGRGTPSLIVAWPDGTPTPAADPAVLAALEAKGYTLANVNGFRSLVIPIAQLVAVAEVSR